MTIFRTELILRTLFLRSRTRPTENQGGNTTTNLNNLAPTENTSAVQDSTENTSAVQDSTENTSAVQDSTENPSAVQNSVELRAITMTMPILPPTPNVAPENPDETQSTSTQPQQDTESVINISGATTRHIPHGAVIPSVVVESPNNQDHNRAISSLRQDHNRAISSLRQDHTRAISRLQSKINHLKLVAFVFGTFYVLSFFIPQTNNSEGDTNANNSNP